MTNPGFDTLFGRHADSTKPLLFLNDGTTLTYHDFLGKVAQLFHAIDEAGLTAGDRLVVQVEKSPDALAIYTCLLANRNRFLPLKTAYTGQKVAYFIADTGARLVLCDQPKAGILTEIADAQNAALATHNADGSGSFSDRARNFPKERGRSGCHSLYLRYDRPLRRGYANMADAKKVWHRPWL